MAPKPKDKKGAKGAKKTESSSSGEARDPKTMTFKEREEVCSYGCQQFEQVGISTCLM